MLRRLALFIVCALSFAGCASSTPEHQQGDHHAHHDGAATGTHHDGAHPASQPASQPAAPSAFDTPPPEGTAATCPVSGESFVVKADTPRAEHGGKHFVFCCAKCKKSFDEDPDSFAD